MTDKTPSRVAFEAWAKDAITDQPLDAAEWRLVFAVAWLAWQAARAQPEQTPIARVAGYHGGHCIVVPTDPARLLQMNMALYAAPQPAEPALHDAQSELPRLPDPTAEAWGNSQDPRFDAYTADQMREYGQLCRTSDRDAVSADKVRIDYVSPAKSHGRLEGTTWRFDDMGLSLYANAIGCAAIRALQSGEGKS